MEIAIPGIALSLMYIMNNQSNNNEDTEEAFGNNNALPNTNVPNRNYPSEHPIISEEIDRTSLLSTVNKIDTGGGVYTDRYFDANMSSKREQPEN